MGGQRQDRHPRQPRLFGPDGTRGLAPVHLGHRNVHKDKIGPKAAPQVHRLPPVVGKDQLDPARTHHLGKDQLIGPVVLGRQHPHRAPRLRQPWLGPRGQGHHSPRQLGQPAIEIGPQQRLLHHRRQHPRRQRRLHGRGLGRHQNHRRPRPPGAQGPRQRHPIHLGQVMIGQHQVKDRPGLHRRQCLCRRPARGHRDAAGRQLPLKDRAVDETAVHHQHPPQARGQARGHRLFGHGQHQAEAKARPPPRFAVHPDRALHPFHQPPCDGQPQPRALEAAVRGILNLVELAKDVVQKLRRDPDACILYRDVQPLPARIRLDPHHPHQHMPGLGELHRIAQQIGQHLPQPPRIADKTRGQEHVEIDHQIDPLFTRARLQQHHRLVDDPLQIKGFGMQHQPPRLDLGIIQDVVDDHQKCLAR